MTRMTLPGRALVGIAVAVAMAHNGRAFAQGPEAAAGGATLTVKTGANIERARYDGSGESAGLGLAMSLRHDSNWGGEIDFWWPRYMDISRGRRHRDLQLNISALRLFRQSGVRPFICFGGSIGLIQHRSSRGSTSSGVTAYFHSGAGVEIPMGQRLALVPELRLNLAPNVGIVRPNIGLRVAF